MNIVGCVACIVVALDCVEKAVGMAPDRLFAPDWLWLWGLIACFWAVAAFLFATGKRY